MEKFAGQLALDLRTAFESLPQEIAKGTRIGFVFFRDETDAEKRVIIPRKPVADAVKILADAATPTYMTGGGDPAEPVLDAVLTVQTAAFRFPLNWTAELRLLCPAAGRPEGAS